MKYQDIKSQVLKLMYLNEM